MGTDRALTTRAILGEEKELVAWAERRKNPGLRPWGEPRPIHFADHLTPGQVAVVAAVADGADLELVVGPTGAGKTTTLAAAALNVSARTVLRSGWLPPPLQPNSDNTPAVSGALTRDYAGRPAAKTSEGCALRVRRITFTVASPTSSMITLKLTRSTQSSVVQGSHRLLDEIRRRRASIER